MTEDRRQSAGDTFWGKALGLGTALVVGTVAAPIAIMEGMAERRNGGRFEDGAQRVFEPVRVLSNRVATFGDQHRDDLTRGAISAAMSAVAGEVARSIDGR